MACAASGCATCLFAAGPVVTYLMPAPPLRDPSPVDVGPDNLAEGGFKAVKVGSRNLLIVRSEGRLSCVNAKCTHLGGVVKWNAGAQEFRCGIHGATFDRDGANPTSPAPGPLTRFDVRSANGRLIVTV